MLSKKKEFSIEENLKELLAKSKADRNSYYSTKQHSMPANNRELLFIADPRPFNGRYSVIPGDEPKFHVNRNGEISIYWKRNGVELRSLAINDSNITTLAETINKIKGSLTRNPGGSFQINEYGRVVLPVKTKPIMYYYAGQLQGDMWFSDPEEDGKIFNLDADENMQTGDNWGKPYIGMPFKISNNGEIEFRQLSNKINGQELIKLARPNSELSNLLLSIRPDGCRFILNYYGIVLTKVLVNQEWRRVYVGKKILYEDNWFPDEY